MNPAAWGIFWKSKAPGELNSLLEDTLFILETAAVVHDGIMASLGKLGSSGGKCQEQEPVAVPIRMLGGLGFATEAIDMVAPSR